MGIMDKFFGGKSVAITSDMMRSEIARAETEIASLHAKLDGAMADVAVMTDAEHVKAEADIAATRRAIARLDARIKHLTAELPIMIVAEEAAAKAATNEALRKRAEAARRMNEKEAAKLLAEYDLIAPKLGDILARLNEIAAETNATNKALHDNPGVAEGVINYETLHRKHPDRQANERREMRHVWIHDNGKVEIAQLDQSGNPIKADRIWNHMKQGYGGVNLERRDVIVGQTKFRSGHYESPLSAIILPAGFAGGAFHWPRQ